MTSVSKSKSFPLQQFKFWPLLDYKYFSGVGYLDPALNQDIERLRELWQEVQASRDRDAIYKFLRATYELVLCWKVERHEVQHARRALKINGLAPPEEPEPFAAIIAASVSPSRLDRRQLSKYSRALRHAAACDCRPKELKRFIKRRWAGINNCAANFRGRLRRQ